MSRTANLIKGSTVGGLRVVCERYDRASVTLVDAYGPGNSRSSSGDESRILRCGYGPDEIYSRFARRSRELWCELETRHGAGLPLWHPCGVLWTSAIDDPYLAQTLATLTSGPYAVERLDRASLEEIGQIGGPGRKAGEFYHLHSLGVDPSGNLVTGESQGYRVQKFVYKGLSTAVSR